MNPVVIWVDFYRVKMVIRCEIFTIDLWAVTKWNFENEKVVRKGHIAVNDKQTSKNLLNHF